MASIITSSLLVCLTAILRPAPVSASLPAPPSYVFTMDGDICVYDYDSPVQENPATTCLAEYSTNLPLYLELNLAQDLLYFSHHDDIYQIPYKEGANATVLMYSAGTISDLAFDWLSRNLYFVDRSLGAIRVMTSQGDHTVSVVRGVSGIKALVVDPLNRYLFWINGVRTSRRQYTYSMGRSRLDGSEQNHQFYTALYSPAYITLDHQQNRIYWTDTNRRSLESIDFEGADHQVLFEEVDKYPYRLAVDQDYVIWVDNYYYPPTVYWTNKTSGRHTQVDAHWQSRSQIGDILVFGEYSQPTGHSNGCSVDNGGCSHICFAVSDTDKSCVCSLGFILEADGTSCVPAARGELGDNLVIADAARGGIYFLNTLTRNVSAVDIPRQSLIESVAVDPVHGYVFWANTHTETIERARLDGTEVKVIKTFQQGHSIIGLAVDFSEELLFYCDIQAGMTSSITYSGSTETLLLAENDTVAIVPDIQNKELYLAISGSKSRISRISYSGSMETTLIDKIHWPLSLAVDFEECKMYWVDYYYHFEWSDLDGSNRNTRFITWHSAFFSMTILHNFIYIADWGANENQVGRIEKENPKIFRVFGTDEFLHLTKISNIFTLNNTRLNSCPRNSSSTQAPVTSTTMSTTTKSTSTTSAFITDKASPTSASSSISTSMATTTAELTSTPLTFKPTTTTQTTSTFKPTTTTTPTTSTVKPTTSKQTTSTFKPTTTTTPITSTVKPTTSKQTTSTFKPTTSKQTTSTFKPTTSKQTTSTFKPTTSKQTTSTFKPTTSKQTTSTFKPTTSKQTTSTFKPTTSKQTTSTFKPTTSKQTTSTVNPTTTTKSKFNPTTSKTTTSIVKPILTKPTTSNVDVKVQLGTGDYLGQETTLDILPPEVTTRDTVSVDKQLGTDDNNGGDGNTGMIAGVSVGVFVIIIVVLSIAVYCIRNRRTIPPSETIINNMAFENPEYADFSSNVHQTPRPVHRTHNAPLGLPPSKASAAGAGFPYSCYADSHSITGYSTFNASFRDDRSFSGASGYSSGIRRNSNSSRHHSRKGSTPSVCSGSKSGGRQHGNGSVISKNSIYMYRGRDSDLYESLPSVYKGEVNFGK